MMELEIRKLEPNLADVFVDYLGHMDFSHEPFWGSCFCRYYYTDCTFEEWIHRTGEENREEAQREIRENRMSGYLAFDGAACVGWVNCAESGKLPRIMEDLSPYCGGRNVACTICFVIHPDYRGKSVARRLLAYAIQDSRQKGFDAMIALPFENPEKPQKRYRGTPNMYLEAGYRTIGQTEDTAVLWLDL